MGLTTSSETVPEASEEQETPCKYLRNKSYREAVEYAIKNNIQIKVVTYNNRRVDGGSDMMESGLIYLELEGTSPTQTNDATIMEAYCFSID